MISFRKILASIVAKLDKNIPGIEVNSQDIEEGFKRPSFFIELDNININDYMTKIQERNITVRITYFPSKPKKNQIELLDIMDKLQKTFIEDNSIELEKDFFTEVEDAEMVIVDRVVHFSFDIYISEEYERAITNELMEELEIK